jgi:hypothetical protein
MNCPKCGHSLDMTVDGDTLLQRFSVDQQKKLSTLYPGLNLDAEAQHCSDWYFEKGKVMKQPRAAFQNWLKKSWRETSLHTDRRPPEAEQLLQIRSMKLER